MVFDLIPPDILLISVLITLFAGFVKGAVGFAMPLIMVSGISMLVEPRIAVAAMIVPIVVSNLMQVARHGWSEARAAIVEFRRFLIIVCLTILISAQLLTMIPPRVMYVVLGVPVVTLSVIQLVGWRFTVPEGARARYEWGIGLAAGVLGGLAGVWGPPTVLYLLALDTEKKKQLTVQGVVYGLGSVMLLVGHTRSGVLNAETLPFSVMMLAPAVVGMWIGFRFGDRLDAVKFRRATLLVLVIAGLNLIRRGIFG